VRSSTDLLEQVRDSAAQVALHATKFSECVRGASCDTRKVLGAENQQRNHCDHQQVDR
jgi:hypothetical protein